ncbi:hypothetical protein JXB37_03125 [candidate division WOR-3 bacterium]|nr:hypothetical protein [candidate division WOR-3 bacterium]
MKLVPRIEGLLASIGLTGLEAAAYAALLREPGATAYHVAQLIGRAPANTYKALDGLLAKGAVVVDESSGSKTYAALPVREYLNTRRRELDARQDEIEQALAGETAGAVETGVYRLASADQVYERCRALIDGAKMLALVDAFPAPLAELTPALCAAAKRGVDVLVKPYATTAIPGCEVLEAGPAEPQLEVWNGDWLNVIADCSQSVQAFLAKDGAGVHAAAWCRNPYLAMLDFNGMASEFILTRVAAMADRGEDGRAIDREIKRMMGRYMAFRPFVSGLPGAWLRHPKPAPVRRGARGKK